MKEQEDIKEEEAYGGLETLPQKEKIQFFMAFALVVLALIAFMIKIYFL